MCENGLWDSRKMQNMKKISVRKNKKCKKFHHRRKMQKMICAKKIIFQFCESAMNGKKCEKSKNFLHKNGDNLTHFHEFFMIRIARNMQKCKKIEKIKKLDNFCTCLIPEGKLLPKIE